MPPPLLPARSTCCRTYLFACSSIENINRASGGVETYSPSQITLELVVFNRFAEKKQNLVDQRGRRGQVVQGAGTAVGSHVDCRAMSLD